MITIVVIFTIASILAGGWVEHKLGEWLGVKK